MLYLDRLDGIPEHLFLNLTIGLSEPVMLPLVFRPGVDFEALQVGIRRFYIGEDAPAYRAIPASDALDLVNLMEKLGSFNGVNDILYGYKDRPLIWVRSVNHDRFNPAIPDAEIHRRIR